MTSPGHRDHVLAHDTSLLECPVCRGDVRQRVHALHHGPQRARGDVAGDVTQHGGVGIGALNVRMRRAPYTLDAAIAARAAADSPTVTIRPPLASRLR